MQASLLFRITPRNIEPAISLNLHISGAENGPAQTGEVKGGSHLLPLAYAMLQYRLECMRHGTVAEVVLKENHFQGAELWFGSAWHLVKNAMRPDSRIEAADHLQQIKPWLIASQEKGQRQIRVNTAHIRPRDVVFSVIARNDRSEQLNGEANLMKLMDFLVGRCHVHELFAAIGVGPPMTTDFKFGGFPTKTTVVHRFVHGLTADSISCNVSRMRYLIPDELEPLITRAHDILKTNEHAVRKMEDLPMLAPSRVEVSMADLDEGKEHVSITFVKSSYRYYAPFAFAQSLANYDDVFDPLVEFTRRIPSARQPAPASCSMGVRVLVETADRQLLVAQRSDTVKLNPNAWSVSANEGLRSRLLETGTDGDLLTRAVTKALASELRLEARDFRDPTLLSLYRNEFNQWGAGFWAKTELTSRQVINRQTAADHAFEHQAMACLPTDIEACGRAMRDLGPRWYGGALETLCQVLAWRALAAGQILSLDEVASELNRHSSEMIRPVDEPNSELIPARP